MSHNRDLSAAAAQLGFHSSNVGIGSEAPRYALDVYNSNLLVSGPSAGNIILEDRGVGDSSRPFHVVSSDGGKFVINRSNRNASGTTTSSVNSLTLNSSGNLGLGQQTSPAANIHIGDISGGYELKITANALQFNRSSNSYIDQLHDTGSILFRMTSSNTEAMRITSAGKIGINNTSPTAPLSIKVGSGGEYVQDFSGSSTKQFGFFYDQNNWNAATFRIDEFDNNGTATSRFAITNGGKFGFNAANPPRDYCFHSGQADTNIQITNNTTGIDDSAGALIQQDGNDLYIWNKENSFMSLGTNAAERMRITGDGNMGLGVNPSYSGVFGGSQRVLHIGGTTAPGLRIQSSTSNQGDFIIQAGNSGGATYFSNLSNNANTSFYNTSGGSTTEKVRITHDGYVLKSDTPAFQCKLSTATGSNFNGFLTFTSVRFNIGNHYSSSNGRFTAPVDGRYIFSWYTNMLRDGGTGSLWADWYVNGGAQGNRMYTHYSGAWELIGGTIIMDLNSSDYVQIYTGQNGNWDGGSYGAFSGYLLG